MSLRTTEGSPPVLLSKTCQNCFMLKIRCDRTQKTDICDRCARLGKPCVFRPARRRDNSAKRDSRIHALEQQVQDLLRVQQTPLTQQPLPDSAPSIPALAPSIGDAASDGDVIDEDLLTMERAETLVEMYKSDMMPHFPFIILPPHVTARSLRHDKSFLFLAILSVASFHDLKTQEQLGNRFKYLVSDKILLGGDDCLSLEYLQGLLIVLAWNQYHGQSKFYSQYLQLAVSIAVDMRLDRKPIRNKPTDPGSKRDPIAGTLGTQNWGSEEQRAAAGLFYLSSTISKLLDKMNTFPCTKFIEDGTLALRQRGDYGTDRDLYHVIRLQRIIENIDSIADQTNSNVEAQESYLRFHTAKLFLHQVAFFERSLQHNPALHLNTLREGLESAKSFLDLYLWLPPKSEMALTNSEWIQLSFGVTLAAKFAIVSKDPTVEPQTRELRRRLNIDNIFRHLSLRIGALVGRAGDGKKERDIFNYYEQRVRKIQSWFEKMIRATGSDSPMSQQTNVSHITAPTRSAQILPQVQLNSADSLTPPQQVQMPTTSYSPQQSMHYPSNSLSTPAGTAGLSPMSQSPYSTGYSPAPAITFPDLMNAPGWELPFTIPMEDTVWAFDMSGSYQGMNMANSPSDGSWGSTAGI